MGWNQQNVFTVLIVQGGAGSGLFVYSPSPGAGNLVGSFTGQSGTDIYGNPFPAGLFATEGTFAGSVIAGLISNTPIGSSAITGSDYRQGTIESTVITLDASGGQVLAYGSATVVTTFNANGNMTFPAGVTRARVQAWGGSGGTGPAVTPPLDPVPGAGGGEYAEEPNLVVHAATYAVTVGSGGTVAGGNGTSSSFPGDAVTVTAHGGKGRAEGQYSGGDGGTGSTNSIHFPGGSGGGSKAGGTHGGGGGSSAGTASAGNAGASGQAGGAGGTAPTGGFAGGAGGTSNNPGAAGSAPGGAPGGAGFSGTPGQGGTAGRVVVTYQTTPTNLIAALAGVSGTDAAGNAFGAGYTGQVKAFAPGVSPAVVETWHSLGTLAGYTVVIGRYKLTSDGSELELDIKCTGGGAQAQTVTFSTVLPAAYRPATQHDTLPMGTTKAIAAGDIWPRLLVDTAGNVTVNASPNSATTIACSVRVPLD